MGGILFFTSVGLAINKSLLLLLAGIFAAANWQPVSITLSKVFETVITTLKNLWPERDGLMQSNTTNFQLIYKSLLIHKNVRTARPSFNKFYSWAIKKTSSSIPFPTLFRHSSILLPSLKFNFGKNYSNS